jgi:hypothetical protein
MKKIFLLITLLLTLIGTMILQSQIVFATSVDLLETFENPNNYGTSSGDRFGYSVAMSDSYAIVGAYTEDDSGGTSSGAA